MNLEEKTNENLYLKLAKHVLNSEDGGTTKEAHRSYDIRIELAKELLKRNQPQYEFVLRCKIQYEDSFMWKCTKNSKDSMLNYLSTVSYLDNISINNLSRFVDDAIKCGISLIIGTSKIVYLLEYKLIH